MIYLVKNYFVYWRALPPGGGSVYIKGGKALDKNRLVFFTNRSRDLVIAAYPTGPAIAFNSSLKKWDYAPRDYFQLTSMCIYEGFDSMTYEEAAAIFNDIFPDEALLDKIEARMHPRISTIP